MELDDGDIHPIQLKPLLVSSLLCSVLFFSSVLLAAAATTATLSHYSTLPLKARKKGEKKSKKKVHRNSNVRMWRRQGEREEIWWKLEIEK